MHTFYSILIFIHMLLGQDTPKQAVDITGVYQLQGVPETAGGFRFNADFTFEFFFSYGAIDRYASGTFIQNDSCIMLTGDKIAGKDFAITKSSKRGKGSTLQVNNPNVILKKDIICVFYKGGIPELHYTDKNGICNFHGIADSIQLIHPLYPDEPTVLLSSSYPEDHNFLELSLQSSMEQLCFLQVPIQIKNKEFTCMLPWLSGEKVLNFFLVEDK